MKAAILFSREAAPESNETEMTDAELLKSFVEHRDQAAFESLVRSYGPIVSGVCHRILKNHHDAEDAFQATFLILAHRANSITRKESLANWLYKVAYNTALNAQQTVAKRRLRETSMTPLNEPAADDLNQWPDLEPIVDRELNRLPDKYRIPLILCDMQGKTRQEAARQLGWPEQTVSSRVAKARSILAQRFVRHGVVLPVGALAVLLSQNAASAAVPGSLVAATTQAATLFAAGNTATVGAASSNAAALTNMMLKSMLFAKIKIAVVALFAISAIVIGVSQQAAPKLAPVAALPTGLPAEVQEALEQNAKLLGPITVGFTRELKTKIPEQEAYERLKMSPEQAASAGLFAKVSYREIWQDPLFYASVRRVTTGRRIRKDQLPVDTLMEWSFDGNVQYRGDKFYDSTTPARVTKSRKRIGETPLHAMSSPFFKAFSGLSFRQKGDELTDLDSQSDLLAALREGGRLVSVEKVSLEDRPHVKIEIDVVNPTKSRADSLNLDELGSRTITIDGEDGQKDKLEAECTPEEQAEVVANIVRQRNLPETKRMVYYLDPALHYAVRRLEERYEPDRLLRRCDCSEFEKLGDRDVWLPRHCESEIHEFKRFFMLWFQGPGRRHQNVSDLAFQFDDSFLTEVLEVTELSGKAVSDEVFKLDETQPGTQVQDHTVPVSDQNPRGVVAYNVGNSPQQTQQNIEVASQEKRNAPDVLIPDAPAPRSRNVFGWIIIGNVLLAVMIGAFLLFRRLAR